MRFDPKHIQAFEQFSARVEELEGQVRSLKATLTELWESGQMDPRVFELERPAKDMEAPAQPTPRLGREAFQLTLDAMSDWYAPPGYDTKAVHRTPGAVLVSSASDLESRHLVDQIESINETKQQIRQDLKGMGHPDTRFELVHRRFYMMVVTQLIRQITAFVCPPHFQSVTFTWGFKTEIRSLDVDEACQVLERMRQRPVNSEDAMSWDERVSQEQARLRSLASGTELRHRRPLPVRPLANLRWHFTQEQKQERERAKEQGEHVPSPTIMREAHTPILLINPYPALKVGQLKSFDALARAQRAPRDDRLAGMSPVTDIAPIYALKGD